MQRSMIGGQPAGGRSPGHRVFFWVLMVVASVWVIGAPIGPPGEPRRPRRSIKCPACGEIARRQNDGSYVCTSNSSHISWIQPDGSIKLGADNPPTPVPSASSEQESGQLEGEGSKEKEVG